MGPNCLQRLSADDTSRQRVNDTLPFLDTKANSVDTDKLPQKVLQVCIVYIEGNAFCLGNYLCQTSQII